MPLVKKSRNKKSWDKKSMEKKCNLHTENSDFFPDTFEDEIFQ